MEQGGARVKHQARLALIGEQSKHVAKACWHRPFFGVKSMFADIMVGAAGKVTRNQYAW
jgi:hypothetical protein